MAADCRANAAGKRRRSQSARAADSDDSRAHREAASVIDHRAAAGCNTPATAHNIRARNGRWNKKPAEKAA